MEYYLKSICVTDIILIILIYLSTYSYGFLPWSVNNLYTTPAGLWSHTEITRTAVLRSAAKYFNDNPIQNSQAINLNVNLTAACIFEARYGYDASATEFINALVEITEASAAVDFESNTLNLAKAHFNSEKIIAGNERLILLKDILITSLNNNEFESARDIIGQILHSIQDFYSHTMWVEYCSTVAPLAIRGQNPAVGTLGTCGYKTSGYLVNDLDDQGNPITMPIGKNHHGGPYDNTANGINTDGNTDSISPTYYNLHAKAAALAIQASEEFLNNIRLVRGDSTFGALLNLRYGSTLCFVVDTTASMYDDLVNLKSKATSIVNSGNRPFDYVLVSYNFPETTVSEAFITTDPSAFLAKINSLVASGGTYDPEYTLTALKKAMDAIRTGSTVFVFTDETPIDSHLLNDVLTKVEEKKAKVTFMLGDTSASSTTYSTIASRSGGLVTSYASLSSVTSILDEAVQTSKVLLFQADNQTITGSTYAYYTVPVDSSLQTLVVEASSQYYTIYVNIYNPFGSYMTYTTVVSQSTLKIYKITTLAVKGMYQIRIQCSSKYSISMSGQSNVAVGVNFVTPAGQGSHPGYKKTSGRPLKDQQSYIYTTLTGVSNSTCYNGFTSKVSTIVGLEMVSTNGTLLGSLQLLPIWQSLSNEGWLTSTTSLPGESFRFRINARDTHGYVIHRMLPTVVQTATSYLQTRVEKNETWFIKPGNEMQISVDLTNVGPTDTFTLAASDTGGFVQGVTPSSFTLATNSTITSTLTVRVPESVIPGKVTSITLIGNGQNADTAYNFLVFRITVEPKELDNVLPNCTILPTYTNNICIQSDSLDVCQSQSWSIQFSASDNDGLYSINSKEKLQNVSISFNGNFTIGTNETLTGKLTSTCCNTVATILVSDMVGNLRECPEVLVPHKYCSFSSYLPTEYWSLNAIPVSHLTSDSVAPSCSVNKRDKSACLSQNCNNNLITYIDLTTHNGFFDICSVKLVMNGSTNTSLTITTSNNAVLTSSCCDVGKYDINITDVADNVALCTIPVDVFAPSCVIHERSSCDNNQKCSDMEWTSLVEFADRGGLKSIALLFDGKQNDTFLYIEEMQLNATNVFTFNYTSFSIIPNGTDLSSFNSSINLVNLTIKGSCCATQVILDMRDTQHNIANCTVSVPEVPRNVTILNLALISPGPVFFTRGVLLATVVVFMAFFHLKTLLKSKMLLNMKPKFG